MKRTVVFLTTDDNYEYFEMGGVADASLGYMPIVFHNPNSPNRRMFAHVFNMWFFI